MKKRLVHEMIFLYCRKNHNSNELCKECIKLEEYAFLKLENCPIITQKVSCSKCKIHCYKEPERTLIKTVMRFSGPRIIFHSPLLVLKYMIKGRKSLPKKKGESMSIKLREFNNNDIPEMISIWNEIVEQGIAFPQIDKLNQTTALEFFNSQTFTGIAVEEGTIVGIYILHPNNIGRCAHLSNASYAVASGQRGKGIGEKLVRHSMLKAKEMEFRILQFNAVVSSNDVAIKLYNKLGFTQMGTIPGGFLSKENDYLDITPHFIEL